MGHEWSTQVKLFNSKISNGSTRSTVVNFLTIDKLHRTGPQYRHVPLQAARKPLPGCLWQQCSPAQPSVFGPMRASLRECLQLQALGRQTSGEGRRRHFRQAGSVCDFLCSWESDSVWNSFNVCCNSESGERINPSNIPLEDCYLDDCEDYMYFWQMVRNFRANWKQHKNIVIFNDFDHWISVD